MVSFDHQSQIAAMGRPSTQRELISAVDSWLQGQTLEELYDQFEFVDKTKRTLKALEVEIIRVCSELNQCASYLHHLSDDLYELWFRAKDRACCIYCYGENSLPNATFFWDECSLFQVQTEDCEQLAMVLKRWLYDYRMPSDLREEFPWIDVGELARYYEEGRGVEGEFIMSWHSVERFYGHMNMPCKPQIIQLIAQARRKGYDRTLRAGQALYSLIVSRSRRHGLRSGQPHIVFDFGDDGMDVHVHFEETKKMSFSSFEFTPQIDLLLKQLEAKDID